MPKTKTKIEKLEELFANKLSGIDEEALGEVCAGILDVPDSFRTIFEETLPKFERLDSTAHSDLLEELTTLRFEFEHMREHAEAAVAGLDRLILILQEKE